MARKDENPDGAGDIFMSYTKIFSGPLLLGISFFPHNRDQICSWYLPSIGNKIEINACKTYCFVPILVMLPYSRYPRFIQGVNKHREDFNYLFSDAAKPLAAREEHSYPSRFIYLFGLSDQ